MVIRKLEEGDETYTGNWNSAREYSEELIIKLLLNAKDHLRLARSGALNVTEEIQNLVYKVNIDDLKLIGFKSLVNDLMDVIDNSLFAIKGETDQKLVKKYFDRLDRIYKLIPKLSTTSEDQVKGIVKVKIVNERYEKLLRIVSHIKRKLLYPMNRSDLIFTSKKEFNPKDFKDKMKKRMTEHG
jgi:hypothetical protein